MIDAFVYPVSAVMKFWHWLLAGVFGMESSNSWVASVVLLVVTIRIVIVPLQWYTYKTARVVVLMRPRLAEIEAQYADEITPESIQAHERAKKELHKEYNYNPLAGCLPALIQIPFFLGLYRLLLRMAVPSSSAGHSLGVLSPAEVESFRASTLLGVPLPAYVSMTPEQFAHLGTTLADVRALAIPMLLAAVCFTTLNLAISQIRSRSTLDWGSALAHRSYVFIWALVPVAGLGLAFAGLTGLVPIALLLYWVSGNFFTFIQTIVLWYLMVKLYPLADDHRAHILEKKSVELSHRREARDKKRSRRRRKLSAMSNPSTYAQVRAEIRAEKDADKAAAEEAKAEKKRANAQRREAMREIRRKRIAERKQRGSSDDSQME